MCSKEKAQDLVTRMKTLPFFGDAREFSAARKETGLALVDAASNDDHATLIVDGLMRRLHKFPVPADVYEEAAGTKPKSECYSAEEQYGPRPSHECRNCEDVGWFTHEETGTFKACWCAAGQTEEVLRIVGGLNAKFSIGGRREAEWERRQATLRSRTGAIGIRA